MCSKTVRQVPSNFECTVVEGQVPNKNKRVQACKERGAANDAPAMMIANQQRGIMQVWPRELGLIPDCVRRPKRKTVCRPKVARVVGSCVVAHCRCRDMLPLPLKPTLLFRPVPPLPLKPPREKSLCFFPSSNQPPRRSFLPSPSPSLEASSLPLFLLRLLRDALASRAGSQCKSYHL